MHAVTRTALILSVVIPVAAGSAHAQSGRADLRCTAPLPSTVLFTTIDTIESTMSGLPTGSMMLVSFDPERRKTSWRQRSRLDVVPASVNGPYSARRSMSGVSEEFSR